MASQTTTVEQTQGASDPKVQYELSPNVNGKLSYEDRCSLERLLCEQTDYVDHTVLHKRDADKLLFGVEAQLVPPDSCRFPEPTAIELPKPKTAGRMPSLSTEQEQNYFQRLNYIRMRISKLLSAHTDKPISLKTARVLIAWYHWETTTRAQIVEKNIPLVLAMAKRTRLVGVDFNEMISEGNMALLRSVDKFDCGKGFKFSTYSCRAILKSFSRVALRTSRYRGTFPVEFDPSIEKSDHMERKRENEQADCVSDLKDILTKNIADLTAVEETVIRQRFAIEPGVNEAAIPKTLAQVGETIGVTKERVRQIQNKALKKIKHALEVNYLAA